MLGGSRKKRHGGMTNKSYGGKRGGDGAADYALKMAGTEQQQYSNVFGPNPAIPASQSNALIVKNPTTGQPFQLGGKRRSRKYSKKGGVMGMISQAIVPFGLLFAQQKFGKARQSRSMKRTRKMRR